MAGERQWQLIRGDAAAVIHNLNAFGSAAFYDDLNTRCPGVQGIFDQLFRRRCRPLHNLASGDFPYSQ